MDDRTVDLIHAGLAGATPPIYRGPDGRHRFANINTIEEPEIRAIRARHMRGLSMDRITTEIESGNMPGIDEALQYHSTTDKNTSPSGDVIRHGMAHARSTKPEILAQVADANDITSINADSASSKANASASLIRHHKSSSTPVGVHTAPRHDLTQLIQDPEESGYYTYGTPPDGAGQYGRPETLSVINAVELQWSMIDNRRIGIGNISLEKGGEFEDHKSHRKGLSIDIRSVRKDGLEQGTDYRHAPYDREATKKLIEMFIATGAVKVIYFNDPEILKDKQFSKYVKHMPGHDDHLHVEVRKQ